jgi:hypothetical protein
MAEATPPSSGPSGSITGQTSVMFRNIIVGVTTTILGSTAVYFLGFHNKKSGDSKGSYAEVKEATTKAWRSYVTIDNIYYKNLLSINKDKDLVLDLDRYKNEMFKEGARFKKDAEAIINDKDVDKSFVSMMERRFDREKQAEDAITIYIDNLKSIINSTDSPEEKQKQVMSTAQAYQGKANGIMERTLNEMEDLSKVLSERYGQQFNLNDIQAFVDYKSGKLNTNLNNNSGNNNGNPSDTTNMQVDPNIFPGRWNTTGANITLNADGNFFWDVLSTGDKSSGSWKIYNNQLYMYPKQPGNDNPITWVFNLSVVNPNLFTMTLNTQPFNTYQLARIKE